MTALDRWEDRINPFDTARRRQRCRTGERVATDAPCPRCGHRDRHNTDHPMTPKGTP